MKKTLVDDDRTAMNVYPYLSRHLTITLLCTALLFFLLSLPSFFVVFFVCTELDGEEQGEIIKMSQSRFGGLKEIK